MRETPCHIECDVPATALARYKRALRSGTRAILSIDEWFELLDDEPHVFVRRALDPGRLISRQKIIALTENAGRLPVKRFYRRLKPVLEHPLAQRA